MSLLSELVSVVLVVLLLTAGIGGVLSYKQVPEGHAGVEKKWGAVSGDVLSSGPHWTIPIQDSIQDVEIRPRTYTMSNTQGEGQKDRADAIPVKTVNGSSVDVSVTIRYRINEDEADTFVEVWNNEPTLEEKLIRPTLKTVLRDEASGLETTGDDAIYTQEGRESLEETATEALEEKFSDEPVILEEVQIRDTVLPSGVQDKLNQKEEAKQQVQVELAQVQQQEAKAQQKIVRAEADAEAINIRGEALEENPVVLKDRYIQALENGNTVYVPTEDGGVTLTRETGGNQTVVNGGE